MRFRLIWLNLFETVTTATIQLICVANLTWNKQEVDEFAANVLIEILENPEAAPNPRLNPFNPVGVIENLNQSSLIRLIFNFKRIKYDRRSRWRFRSKRKYISTIFTFLFLNLMKLIKNKDRLSLGYCIKEASEITCSPEFCDPNIIEPW